MANGEVSAIKAAKESAASNAAAQASNSQSVAAVSQNVARANQNTIKLDDFRKK
jgi:hypothetical protein